MEGLLSFVAGHSNGTAKKLKECMGELKHDAMDRIVYLPWFLASRAWNASCTEGLSAESRKPLTTVPVYRLRKITPT